MSKDGCIHRLNSDGSVNPKYVDLLEEDKPISGQKFVCVSFVSPENILKKNEILEKVNFAEMGNKQFQLEIASIIESIYGLFKTKK